MHTHTHHNVYAHMHTATLLQHLRTATHTATAEDPSSTPHTHTHTDSAHSGSVTAPKTHTKRSQRFHSAAQTETQQHTQCAEQQQPERGGEGERTGEVDGDGRTGFRQHCARFTPEKHKIYPSLRQFAAVSPRNPHKSGRSQALRRRKHRADGTRLKAVQILMSGLSSRLRSVLGVVSWRPVRRVMAGLARSTTWWWGRACWRQSARSVYVFKVLIGWQ